MTAGTKRKMTDLDHNAEERNYTNALIAESEYTKYADNKKVNKTTINDWSEAVVGWKSTENSLNVKTTNPTQVKKKRVVDRSTTDFFSANGPTNPGEEFWSNSSSSADYKPGIRCVGDDFESFPIPPWKSNTEQGTYRYVPDNGSYRTIKFMYDDRKDWYTVRKKYPEKVSTAWHQNCKRMQREMRRQLRRDLSKPEKEGLKSSRSRSSRSNSGKNTSEPNSGDDTSRSTADMVMMPVQPRRGSGPQQEEQSAKTDNAKTDKHKRSLYRNDVRVKSTKSDGAAQNSKKMLTSIHESEPATPIPPQYSIPSGSGIFKSASDLFIENFSSRINALEDEIKKDSKLLRKNESDMVKLQNSRLKFREQTRGSLKEPNNSNLVHITPRMPLKTETLTSDIFSVKSVGQKELKPLEKTKSFNKHSNNHQNGDILQHKGNLGLSGTGSNGISPNAVDWDKAVNGYKTSLENTKQALFNTLTGTKIDTQKPNKRSPSKDFSTPSTITICDHSSTISAHSEHIDSFRQVPVMIEKKQERKAAPPPMHTVPAILPEISGKRLEVNTISHRLL